ncbi:MAG: T9SS type B sorting domain-containing protein, partial [Flavobacteriaceae bacterium]|nr:T9SS type B sorting domain-containing protein [Flavobacteriaceae bacterium]
SKTIVVTGPGVYTCTQTKVGCTVTTRTVTVNGLDVEFNPFNNQCKDSADGGVTIDVTDDAATFNYELSQGGTPLSSTGLITAKSHTFNDLDIGTYDVRVTNNEGCFDIFSFEVQEPTLLTASNVVIDNIMPCNGNSLSGRIEVTGNGGTIFTGGTNEYEYSMDGGAFQTSNIFETTQDGNHTMTVRDANGCTTTTIATIDFDEEIEYVMEKQDVLCYQGTDGSITVNLSQNNAGNTLTYSIDGGANFQSNPTFSGLAKGDYQIIIRKEKGVNTCDITESITLLEQIDLQFEAVGGFSCEGATNTITATVAAEFAGDVTYRINGGSANSTGIFEDVNQGTHTITVQQNSTGCSAEPITIVIDQYIPVSFTVEQNVSSPALRDYIVNAVNGTPDYEYAMLKNPSETVSPEVTDEDFGSSNVFTPPSAGFYTFYVRDARGCIVEEIVEFKDIEIPNFFTPNGDTVNDEWYPRNIELYPNISVQIFDRYQRLIATYQGNDQEGWNGIYKGKELPTGDYWYIVKLNEPTDDREFKGNFTLHRVIN